jgi:hypothetical protein
MHGGAGVLGGDEEIWFASFFARQESEAGLMDRERSCNEVSFRRQHVAVLPNPRDLAIPFHLSQDRVQIHSDAALSPKRFAELDVVERAIVWGAQQVENSFTELSALWFHKVCTLRVISLGHEGKIFAL